MGKLIVLSKEDSETSSENRTGSKGTDVRSTA